MPSEAEIKVMETFVEVLKPIVEITEAIGGDKLVTISTITFRKAPFPYQHVMSIIRHYHSNFEK